MTENIPPDKKGTHIVTTPNKRAITPIENLKVALFQDGMKQVINYYNGSTEEATRFLTAAIEYVRRVPKLLACDRTSLMMAFVQSAQFRFMPSGVSGEAYVIPYGTEAKFQIGYQGIITLLWRTQQIKSLKSIVVYDNEKFEYAEGLDTNIIHIPTKFGEKKGNPIGVYAVAETMNGGRLFKVMSKDDVMAIKEMSKAKNSSESPWNSKDPEKWMWKKTCLIQLAKFLPKSQELQQAIEKDYEGEGFDKPKLDACGPAVAKAFHTPDEGHVYEPTPEEQEEILKAEKEEHV